MPNFNKNFSIYLNNLFMNRMFFNFRCYLRYTEPQSSAELYQVFLSNIDNVWEITNMISINYYHFSYWVCARLPVLLRLDGKDA